MPDLKGRVRLAILISGRGSNMDSIIRAAQAPGYPAQVVVVISSRADAPGLARAGEVPSVVVARDRFASRKAFEAELGRVLAAHRAEAVALAGFMRVLSPAFVRQWEGRMVNIHPSLLPRYPGLDTHARALAAGDREAGATVHLVTAEVDCGPILAQARVPVLAGDTPETLAARVLEAELALYPCAIAEWLRAWPRSGGPGGAGVSEDRI
ncbi:phosphoribosylglycinamide formyltransferase [Thermaurantiacus sp.]